MLILRLLGIRRCNTPGKPSNLGGWKPRLQLLLLGGDVSSGPSCEYLNQNSCGYSGKSWSSRKILVWIFLAFARLHWKVLLNIMGFPHVLYQNSYQTRCLGIGMLLLEQSPVQPSWTKDFNQMVEYQDKNEQRSAFIRICLSIYIYIYIRHTTHVASCIMSRMYPHVWCIRTGIFVFIPSTAFYIVDLLNICI